MYGGRLSPTTVIEPTEYSAPGVRRGGALFRGNMVSRGDVPGSDRCARGAVLALRRRRISLPSVVRGTATRCTRLVDVDTDGDLGDCPRRLPGGR